MGVPLYQGPQPQQPIDGVREVLKICLGLGIGLIPAACAIIFFALLCPFGDSICEQTTPESTNIIGVYLFFGAFLTYLLQILWTIVCVIWRATRPIAIGLLIMLFLGPIVAFAGITAVNMAKFPAKNLSAPQVVGVIFTGIVVSGITE